jgi:hypothetical protein
MLKSIVFIAMAWLLMLAGCKKENIDQADCQQLQNGITTSDKEQVKAVISKLITGLPSQAYSQQNLSNLVNAISQQCKAAATVLCFDCIDTSPSQSEIRISCAAPGGTVERTVDISYTTNNEMVFYNLHY